MSHDDPAADVAKLDDAVRSHFAGEYPDELVAEWVVVAVTVPTEGGFSSGYTYRVRSREGMMEHHTIGLLDRAGEVVREADDADDTP